MYRSILPPSHPPLLRWGPARRGRSGSVQSAHQTISPIFSCCWISLSHLLAFKTKLKPLVPASCQSEISKKLFCSSPVNLSHLSLAGQQSGQRVSGPGNPVGAQPKVALGGSWRGSRCGEPAEKVKVASKYWKVKVTLKVKRAKVASISTFPGYAEPRTGWSGGSRCWTTDEWDTGRPLRV